MKKVDQYIKDFWFEHRGQYSEPQGRDMIAEYTALPPSFIEQRTRLLFSDSKIMPWEQKPRRPLFACPECDTTAKNYDELMTLFGPRRVTRKDGTVRRSHQSMCRACRASKTS